MRKATVVEDARSAHGRADDPLDARVERAFSDAVDRQVAQQRALNQLVETAADRLGAIEAALRSLRETTSTQGVALRAEFQEGVARLAEDVQERFGKLASELDRLRRSSTDHAVRLVQVVRATDASLQSLEERQARLSDQLAELEDREPGVDLSTFAGPSPTTAPEIGGHLADLRDRVAALGDELMGRIDDRDREMRERLEAALDERLGRVEDRLAEFTGGVTDHLRDVRDEVGQRLGAATGRLGALVDDLEARIHLSEERAAATRAASEERLDRLEDQLAAVHREIREDLDAVRELTGDRLDEVATEVRETFADAAERLARTDGELRGVASELSGFGSDLDARVGGAIERAVTVARSEAHDASADVEAAAARIEAVLRRVTDLESNLVAYLDSRDRRLEEQRSRIFTELLDEFADVLSRRQRRRVASALDSARERVVERFSSGDDTSSADAPSADMPGDGAEAGPEPAPDATAGEAPGHAPRGLLAELLGDEEIDGAAQPDGAPPAEPSAARDEEQGHVCPECGFVAKSGGGLASHRRAHT